MPKRPEGLIHNDDNPEDDYLEDNSPERWVRLWNELNPHIKPPACITCIGAEVRWVPPVVTGRPSTDEEISKAVIDIFNKTGRIVVDAYEPKYFVTTPENAVVCVAINRVLEMDLRAESDSDISDGESPIYWDSDKTSYDLKFQQNKDKFPKTVETIKALLFIQSKRPDVNNASFLNIETGLTGVFAGAYDGIAQKQALDILSAQRPKNIANIKESCIKELQNYINLRGSIINTKGDFEPSWRTIHFRDEMLTAKKVGAAWKLIASIGDAVSFEEIEELINPYQNDPELIKSSLSSGLKATLDKCMQIAVAASINPDSESFDESISPP